MRLNKKIFFYSFSIILINICFITSVKAQGSFLDILNPFIKPKESIEKQKKDDIKIAPQKTKKKPSIEDEIDKILNGLEPYFAQPEYILDLLPDEVDLLIRIDFQKFLSQKSSKKLIKDWLKKNSYLLSDYKEIKDKSGFDFFRDINNIYLFSAYKIDKTRGILNGILVDGKFEKDKFLKYAKENAYITRDHYFNTIDGYDVLCPRYGEEGYAILVDDRYLVIGSKLGVFTLKNTITGRTMGDNLCLNEVIEVQDKDLNNKAFIKVAGVPCEDCKEQLALMPNMDFIDDVDYFYFDFGYYYFSDEYNFEAIESNFYVKIYDYKNMDYADSSILHLRSNIENYLKKELPPESYNALIQSKYGGFRWQYHYPLNVKTLHYSIRLSFEEIEKIFNGWKIRELQKKEKGY